MRQGRAPAFAGAQAKMPLITALSQVRVLPGPPKFQRLSRLLATLGASGSLRVCEALSPRVPSPSLAFEETLEPSRAPALFEILLMILLGPVERRRGRDSRVGVRSAVSHKRT